MEIDLNSEVFEYFENKTEMNKATVWQEIEKIKTSFETLKEIKEDFEKNIYAYFKDDIIGNVIDWKIEEVKTNAEKYKNLLLKIS